VAGVVGVCVSSDAWDLSAPEFRASREGRQVLLQALVPHPTNPAVITQLFKPAARRNPDDSAAPSCLGAPGLRGACRFSR